MTATIPSPNLVKPAPERAGTNGTERWSIAAARNLYNIEGWGAGDSHGNLVARITVNNDCNPVPEPATLTLLGIGLAGTAAKLRQRRKKNSS